LGGGLIKQRTARPGQGKSGGYRTIIAYRRGDRAVFLFGFAKSERANLDDDELSYLRRIGRSYLSLDCRPFSRLKGTTFMAQVPFAA